MRSARMILATAAASAALAIGAPGAYAGDTDHDDSSYSKEDSSSYGKEHGKEDDSSYSKEEEDSSYGKEHGKDEHGKEEHGKPSGGMHTGGGALASVNEGGDRAKDPKYDPETYKDKDENGGEHGKDSWNGGKEEESGGWSKEHDKPSGGMHTGGGGLATPSTTAAGLGVLAVAGTGIYALRRKKTVGGVA
ncbi:hypothetical protein J2X68_001709 [Streptomyces sp. 3330]|uniref:hypothetical protein n=1 Tax=Streptomyces sp. 3330 TaxID=2817755 RepID=UPI00286129A7|nr:hypothetical protein [Streptomyces sp. 3330]MDR6975025.1 hypothetical protein [Streptomyces sp. 3330]